MRCKWPGFNLPLPEWYEGDFTEAGYFWTQFDEANCRAQNEPGFRVGPYAMDAIHAITRAGHPLPEELHSWVGEAIGAWMKSEGNKVEVRSKKARVKNRWATHLVWMQFLRGSTIDAACFEVVEKLKALDPELFEKCDSGSIRTEYYSPDFTAQRKSEEWSLVLQHGKALVEGRQDEAEALEKEFPRLFREKGN